ncbi:nuclear transport factor 2 family protein [Mycobacterium sp. AMU20-3851]|uniref:nuclear transport factor 2 family protein n=1 Tax=Mycobacterium sp. AMU20-3851 TaxID=3122055 RepID=UPI0037549FCE
MTAAATLEIENLLTRYCRAVDSKDWAAYRAMFTDDARVDYSAAGLVVGSVEDAVRYLGRHQQAISVGMHYVTNIDVTNIDVTNIGATDDGDTATVIAMWFNAVTLPGSEDVRFFFGRWHDDLVRTENGWRISNLVLEVLG